MTRASQPQGWPRTLVKCLLTTLVLAALGALGLWLLLHGFEAPWFVPRPVLEWLRAHLAPYVLWVGGGLGALVGLLASVGIVVYDARKGRLRRV